MHFAGLAVFAIVLAAVVSFMFGWLWYGILFPQAIDGGCRQDRSGPQGPGRPEPYAIRHPFVALLVMAWVLAGIIGHLGAGAITLRSVFTSGASCGSASSPPRWRSTTLSRVPSRF